MMILNRYVIKSFIVAFGMAILILTFAMTGANLIRVLDFISRGIPLSVFGTYILYMLPRILTFTIPWAVMVAVMLVFGRMSADSELTAMRACGISMLQVVSPLLLPFPFCKMEVIISSKISSSERVTVLQRKVTSVSFKSIPIDAASKGERPV